MSEKSHGGSNHQDESLDGGGIIKESYFKLPNPKDLSQRLNAIEAITELPTPCCICCGSDQAYMDNMDAIRQILKTGQCEMILLTPAERAIILRKVSNWNG